MALLPPLWMQAGPDDPVIDYPRQLDRVGLIGSIFSREGVLDFLGGHLLVRQRAAGANMSVDIAAGRAAIVGRKVDLQGTYLCTSTAIENVAISKPTSGSRTHRVIARVRDKVATSNSDTASDWIIETIFAAGTTPPAVPASAISLAVITVTSSTSTVTNSIIFDARPRSVVGTSALTGLWGQQGFDATYWAGRDATRPLTWIKNPDGWVTLSGWIYRTGAAANLAAGQFYNWDGSAGYSNASTVPVLPPEIRPANGVRDVIGITSNGDIHFVVQPSGALTYRFYYATTLAVGQFPTWISFDGVFYRANSF